MLLNLTPHEKSWLYMHACVRTYIHTLHYIHMHIYFMLSMDPKFSQSDGSEWLTPRPDHFTAGKDIKYPPYRRLGGTQGWSGRVRKISPPPGLDSRTVQPVDSRYTD